MRTMQQLAVESLAVQDACNLSGVVLGWGRAISRLRELLPNVGTDAINRHPINVLWASKVASLTRCHNVSALSDAFDKVEELSRSVPETSKENACVESI